MMIKRRRRSSSSSCYQPSSQQWWFTTTTPLTFLLLNFFKKYHQCSKLLLILFLLDNIYWYVRLFSLPSSTSSLFFQQQSQSQQQHLSSSSSSSSTTATNTTTTTNNNNKKKKKKKKNIERIIHNVSITTTTTKAGMLSYDNNYNYNYYYDDFDLSKPIPCGLMKCFIPSKTNNQNEGYLIGEDDEKSSSSIMGFDEGAAPTTTSSLLFFNRLQEGYEYAIYLNQKYNYIPMTLLGPPINIKRNFDIVKKINDMSYRITAHGQNKFCSTNNNITNNNNYCGNIPLTIQKIKRIPFSSDSETTKSYFVKCTTEKLNRTKTNWIYSESSKEFRQNIIITITNNKDKDKKNKFLYNFQLSINQLAHLTTNEPEFVDDLQFFIDIFGNIHHIDFDRIVDGRYRNTKDSNYFKRWVTKSRRLCLMFLKRMKHDIEKEITDYYSTSRLES